MASTKPPEAYYVEIIRDQLSGFEGRVSNEEAGGSRFIGNEQTTLDGQLVNLAKFEELKPRGTVLDSTPRFVALGEAPASAAVEWTGVVLIDGVLVAVQMFREPLSSTGEPS
jgi:surface antigen